MNEQDEVVFRDACEKRGHTDGYSMVVAHDMWQAALEYARGKQEPVHFRAVLCGEQQDQAFGVVPKVVGFVDKKAAEQFILEKRDFQGWRYSLEPLYTEAPAAAINEQLLDRLKQAVIFIEASFNKPPEGLLITMKSAIAAAEAAKKGGCVI